MMYSRGVAVDEELHRKNHERQANGLTFKYKLKPEDVVMRPSSVDSVVMVSPTDHRYMQKVADVLEIVNQDLGFITDEDLAPHNHKVCSPSFEMF